MSLFTFSFEIHSITLQTVTLSRILSALAVINCYAFCLANFHTGFGACDLHVRDLQRTSRRVTDNGFIGTWL
jgi:predicted DNA repair protein MutK